VDQIRQQLSCQNSASDQSGDEDLLAILKENEKKTRQKNSRNLHSRKTKTKTKKKKSDFPPKSDPGAKSTKTLITNTLLLQQACL
jgi:hypothetical protein